MDFGTRREEKVMVYGMYQRRMCRLSRNASELGLVKGGLRSGNGFMAQKRLRV